MSREIVIEGRTLSGESVAYFNLEHGSDPGEELLSRGWAFSGVVGAYTPEGADGVVIRVAVVAALTGDIDAPEPAGVRITRMNPTGPAERIPPDAPVRRTQRLAAYGVIVRHGRVLLTQLSNRVRAGVGLWTLPGGGIDRGEDPATGLRREVWEETGQVLGETHLIDVLNSRWTGAAPDGSFEDYHVVRLVYVATVPFPGDPVVHDVDGTTAAAEWVALDELGQRPLAAMLDGDRWREWVSLSGEPRSREDREAGRRHPHR